MLRPQAGTATPALRGAGDRTQGFTPTASPELDPLAFMKEEVALKEGLSMIQHPIQTHFLSPQPPAPLVPELELNAVQPPTPAQEDGRNCCAPSIGEKHMA